MIFSPCKSVCVCVCVCDSGQSFVATLRTSSGVYMTACLPVDIFLYFCPQESVTTEMQLYNHTQVYSVVVYGEAATQGAEPASC